MTNNRWAPSLSYLVFSLSVLGFLGCGKSVPEVPGTPQGSCSSTSAVIEVLDGTLRNICGCQETAGAYVTAGAPLTCTISRNTRLVFLYAGTRLAHQIVPVGSPAFSPSPVSDPSGNLTINSHPILFDTTGTYRFQDSYNSGLNGTIVVQ